MERWDRERNRFEIRPGLVVLGIWMLAQLANVTCFCFSVTADDTRVTTNSVETTQDFGRQAKLPLPSVTPIAKYEELLFRFLNDRQYVELGWRGDKRVRDTGPFIQSRYYATHPAVRIYYSPEIIRWLLNGRAGTIPDGAMMIKEHYNPPAARHEGLSEDEIWKQVQSWTVMVKDSNGSYDGWFWSNPERGVAPFDNHQYNFKYPMSGFGQYCLRCHASTQSPSDRPEYTFASLRNIVGFPGEPILFRVDDTWRELATAKQSSPQPSAPPASSGHHPRCTASPDGTVCVPELNSDFLLTYSSIQTRPRKEVLHIPPVTHDWVVRAPRERMDQQAFVTSNQCLSCHSALSGDFGPQMMIYTTEKEHYGSPGRDFSPFGEWRWSPMGLAGRDPVFYAQLETELAILREEFGDQPERQKAISENLVSTCLRCHGVMGKRQWDLDHAESGAPFTVEHVYAIAGRDKLPHESNAHYGALARDGISCMVCHRMQPRQPSPADDRSPLQHFLETSVTGNFVLGPPGEIYGPFKDDEIAPYAMEHALGLKPKHNPYIQSSQMCGSCHTVVLPIVDRPFLEGEETNELVAAEPVEMFRDFHHHVEQATYLEWLNSAYENEYQQDNPQAKSCQECHMSRDLHDDNRDIHLTSLPTRIAAIQDDTYPEAENLAPHKDITVRVRKEGFARHNFAGLNAFLLEIFRQYDDILGVNRNDTMTDNDELPDSISNIEYTARHDTATLDVVTTFRKDQELEAVVTVVNKAGHRFPSGVGFRRAFLEFVVVDESRSGRESIVWSSGRTNSLGVILNDNDQPLPSEYWTRDPKTGQQQYQPHHEVITDSNQVQIYEILLHNHHQELTTSFIHGCDTIKDNRLLPLGWQRDGRHPDLKGYFLKATYPGPDAIQDPRYTDGSGSDEVTYRVSLPAGMDHRNLKVRVSLYYQALPPYFLRTLFETAPDGPATQRLHYMLSNMKLEGTAVEDWKLLIASREVPIDGNPQAIDK